MRTCISPSIYIKCASAAELDKKFFKLVCLKGRVTKVHTGPTVASGEWCVVQEGVDAFQGTPQALVDGVFGDPQLVRNFAWGTALEM